MLKIPLLLLLKFYKQNLYKSNRRCPLYSPHNRNTSTRINYINITVNFHWNFFFFIFFSPSIINLILISGCISGGPPPS